MAKNKSLMLKKKLIKKNKQNRPIPRWATLKKDTSVKWNSKRRHWRKKKLKL